MLENLIFQPNVDSFESESDPVDLTAPASCSPENHAMVPHELAFLQESKPVDLGDSVDIDVFIKNSKAPEIALPYASSNAKVSADEKITIILEFLIDAKFYFGKFNGDLYLYRKKKGFFQILDPSTKNTGSLSSIIIKKASEKQKAGTINNADEITFIALKESVMSQLYSYLLHVPGCAAKIGSPPDGYINFRNCVVDVRTLKTADHDPAFGFTYRIECDFRAGAEMDKTSSAFFKNLAPDSRDRRSLLQVLGLSLIGSEAFDRAAFIIGSPANGKSTFAKLIEGLLPEDACQNLDFAHFGDKFAKIKLANAQVSICHDLAIKKASEDAVATFKNLVTHDTIIGRDLYKSFQKIRPRCFLIFIGNDLPLLPDKTGAIRRRQWLIRTGATVPEEERDPFLLEKLRTDIVGIVSTAIRAVHEAQLLDRPGNVYSNPPEDFSVTATIFSLSSTLSAWCARHLNPTGDLLDYISVAEIRTAFCKMIPKEYLPQVSENGFARVLRNCLPQNAFFAKRGGVSCLCGYALV